MLRVTMIPLIVLILLMNVEALGLLADGIDARFRRDLQTILCAREDVYRRNVTDAYRFLASRYSYVKERSFDSTEFLADPGGDCAGYEALVYREVNAQLPLPAIYPNWIYREELQGEGGDE